MRKLVRTLILKIAQTIGTRIYDADSGKLLGRALIIPWRGKIHVIGLRSIVKPVFEPQTRLTYWKQKIAFSAHPPPDFPNLRSAAKQKDIPNA